MILRSFQSRITLNAPGFEKSWKNVDLLTFNRSPNDIHHFSVKPLLQSLLCHAYRWTYFRVNQAGSAWPPCIAPKPCPHASHFDPAHTKVFVPGLTSPRPSLNPSRFLTMMLPFFDQSWVTTHQKSKAFRQDRLQIWFLLHWGVSQWWPHALPFFFLALNSSIGLTT